MSSSAFDFSQIGVLVVDDNRHMRSLLVSVLHALGVKKIKEAADGETALRDLVDYQPDIVIVDWHMEPMDGLELVHEIRHSTGEDTRYVPIIMLTGHSEGYRVRMARDAGIHEFLAKPISAKALFKRIATIIDHPRPFVRTDDYFGPDRRRKNVGPPEGMKERRKGKGATADNASDMISEEEAEKLLTG